MKAIKINRLTLSNREPKIAVSVTASDQRSLTKQLHQIKSVRPDLVEWRIDALKQLPSENQIKAILARIHKSIQPMPLIATFRTTGEGGGLAASEDQYFQILDLLAASPLVDVLDVELRHDERKVQTVVSRAHQHHVKVIMSNHDFQKVPDDRVILNRMTKMQELHADIAKVAVMPQGRADVMRFMKTSFEADRRLSIPIVTMAMGNVGKITRISGAWTGSVISFGSMNEHVSSAAGQIPVPKLRTVLTIMRGDQDD